LCGSWNIWHTTCNDLGNVGEEKGDVELHCFDDLFCFMRRFVFFMRRGTSVVVRKRASETLLIGAAGLCPVSYEAVTANNCFDIDGGTVFCREGLNRQGLNYCWH
jgi:hypothetical protein